MRAVYCTANNIVSPLGFDSATNSNQVAQENTGITLQSDTNLLASPFYASIINNNILTEAFQEIDDPSLYTKLEKMMILSLKDTIAKASFSITQKTALIISTTKGNIDVLPVSYTHLTLPTKRIV